MIEKAEFSQQENKSGCAPRGTKWDSQRLGATEVSWPAERTGRHVVSQVESGGTSFSHGLFIFLFCCCCLVAQSCPILCDSMDGNHQAPLSMGFLRPEHWSGLPFPSPGVFLTQISASDVWQADSLPLNHLGSPFLCFYSLYSFQICSKVTPHFPLGI